MATDFEGGRHQARVTKASGSRLGTHGPRTF